ncbi:MAG: hypothetical protein ACAH21_03865 [Ramlibacter sp.]|nr:hypothetical protein [Ramlibacter sp.]
MRKLLLASIVALLAGCVGGPFASYEFPPGTPREAVVARMGQPQRVFRLPNGERLEYSMQPFGQQAWMVDVDASGRVMQTRQVLTEENFHRIVPGTWTLADVQREFGRPAKVDAVTSWNGAVLTYRWKDVANSNMFYWVYLDPNNVVQRAHPGMEFVNAPNERK